MQGLMGDGAHQGASKNDDDFFDLVPAVLPTSSSPVKNWVPGKQGPHSASVRSMPHRKARATNTAARAQHVTVRSRRRCPPLVL
mmetsp:Transcript_51212/g.153854  ORF Transcript_51212/g.153854 Transcript_51212/m.153854 type:complete len:84 (+) Transcript_51212:972-1223(+)